MKFTLAIDFIYTDEEREFCFETFSIYHAFRMSLDILKSHSLLSTFPLGEFFVSLICEDSCLFHLSYDDGDFSWSAVMYGLQSLCVADDDQTDNCSKLPEDTDVSDDEEVTEEHEKTDCDQERHDDLSKINAGDMAEECEYASEADLAHLFGYDLPSTDFCDYGDNGFYIV